jgi:hypothetical protein
MFEMYVKQSPLTIVKSNLFSSVYQLNKFT